MTRINEAKSSLVYQTINESNGFYIPKAGQDSQKQDECRLCPKRRRRDGKEICQ